MATVTGGTIKWNLDIDKSGFDSKLDQTSSKSKKFAGVVKKVFLGVGIAVAAGLAVAIKRAASFETALTNISTLLSGDSTKAIAGFKKGILDMMSRVPVSADELGASAYAIVSAGITDTSDALKILETSARLGTAGLGTTEEATTLMVLALNNFKKSGLTSDQAANILFKTVKGGITTIADLSQSFGLVAPLAVDAGVSMEELSAATAALTQVNKSASISQNSLKAAFVGLAKPTEAAKELFIGLEVKTFPELIKKTGGMVAAFQAMKDETKGNTQQFAKAIGSGEALTSVISLLGDQSGAFNESWASMKDGTDALTEAFEKQKGTFSNSMKILRNNLDKIAISVGSKLLPPLANFAKMLGENIGPAMDNVVALIKKLINLMGGWKSITKKVTSILKSLGKIFSKIILPAINDLWETIKKDLLPSLQDLWKVISPILIPALKMLALILGVIVLGAILATINIIRVAVKVFSVIARMFTSTISVAGDMARFFNDIMTPAIVWLKDKVDSLIDILDTFATTLIKIKDGALEFFRLKLDDVKQLILNHQTELKVVAGILGAVFGPALLLAGTRAVIAGGKLALHFVANLINAGRQAVIAAAKLTVQFVIAMVRAGITALVAAGRFAIASTMILLTGTRAVFLGSAKVVGSLARFAAAGWAATAPWLAFAAAVAAIVVSMDQISKRVTGTGIMEQLKALGKLGIGGTLEALKEVSGFQEGGIIPGPVGKPQLAVVHGGEEIIPANGMAKGGITINQTNNITKETDMDAALRELGWKLSI